MNDMMGHNRPPDPLVEAAQNEATVAQNWLKANGNLDLWDADTATRCVALYGDVSKAWEALDGQRLAEGREFRKTQAAKYDAPLTVADLAKQALQRLRTGWLQREDARIKAEQKAKADEAKRLADEAAKVLVRAAKNTKDPLGAQLAAAEVQQRAQEAMAEAEAMPDRAQIRGGGVRTVGLKETWTAEIIDVKKAFTHYKSHPVIIQSIKDAMLRVATMEAKQTKDAKLAPPGVRFISTKG